MEFLSYQIYGPLMSWGKPAGNEVRPTYEYPSKSEVLGMVAAGLGIDYQDRQNILALGSGIGFAIKAFRRRQSKQYQLSDYHTIQVAPPNRRTLVTHRHYLLERYLVLALWRRDGCPYQLAEIKSVLIKPHFMLYIGRLCCSLGLPLNPVITTGITLRETLDQYPCDEVVVANQEFSRYVWDRDLTDQQAGMKATMTECQRDETVSRNGYWTFRHRDYSVLV